MTVTAHRPGRLYKALAPTEPLFRVTIDDTPHTDANIRAIATTRGGDLAGWTPSTATITLTGQLPPLFDAVVAAALTDYGATLIGGITGADPAAIAPRYYGRAAARRVTDHPDPRYVATEVQSSDWSGQLKLAGAVATATSAAAQLWRVYKTLVDAAHLPKGVITYTSPTWNWDEVWLPGGATRTFTFDESAGALSADIGVLVRVRRDGTLEPLPLNWRRQQGVNWRTTMPHPLMRRHVIAPATWELPASSPALVRYQLRYWPEDRTTAPIVETRTASSSTTPRNGRPIRTLDLDTTDVVSGSEQIPTSMRALAERLGGSTYSVPTVDIDLLALLTSDVDADRAQAGQLLALDHGDHLALSLDWPDEIAGVHFVTAIDEKITSSSWTLRLSLAPWRHVLAGPSPDVTGATWDTSYARSTTWDATPGTWT